MFCRTCGKTAEENALFCTGCGARLSGPDTDTIAATVTEVMERPVEATEIQQEKQEKQEKQVQKVLPEENTEDKEDKEQDGERNYGISEIMP